MINAKDCIEDFSKVILKEYSEEDLSFEDSFRVARAIIINMCTFLWDSYSWCDNIEKEYPSLSWIGSANIREFIVFLFYYFNQCDIILGLDDMIFDALSYNLQEAIRYPKNHRYTSNLVFDEVKIRKSINNDLVYTLIDGLLIKNVIIY